MGLGIDIGVDAQRYRRPLAARRRDLFEQFQFGLGFDVEALDAQFQGALKFITALADPGKHHLARITAGGQYPFQLAD